MASATTGGSAWLRRSMARAAEGSRAGRSPSRWPPRQPPSPPRGRAPPSRAARAERPPAPASAAVATPDSRDAPWRSVAAASRASALASSGARPLRCASWKAATSTTPSADVAARPPARRALRAPRIRRRRGRRRLDVPPEGAPACVAVGRRDACCVTTNGKPPLSSATSAPSLAARSPSTSVLELEEPFVVVRVVVEREKGLQPELGERRRHQRGQHREVLPARAVARATAADAAGRRPPAIGNERLSARGVGEQGTPSAHRRVACRRRRRARAPPPCPAA